METGTTAEAGAASTTVAPGPLPEQTTSVAPNADATVDAAPQGGLSSVPASLHAPVNLSGMAAGPDPSGKLPPVAGEEDEPDMADYFEDFVDEVKSRKEAINTDTFVKKLKTIGAEQGLRNELRDWVYGFLVKIGDFSTGHAVAFGRLVDRLDDVEDEQERQGKLVRALASNYLSMLALALANMTLAGNVDENQKKTVAQEIVGLVAQIQAMVQSGNADTQAVLDAVQAAQAQEAAATPDDAPNQGASGTAQSTEGTAKVG